MKKNLYGELIAEDDLYFDKKIEGLSEIFQKMESSKPPEKYALLKQYLLILINAADRKLLNRQSICYIMAGLIPDFDLEENKDIHEILWEAFELELPYHHATKEGTKESYQLAWENLVKKINDLPY